MLNNSFDTLSIRICRESRFLSVTSLRDYQTFLFTSYLYYIPTGFLDITITRFLHHTFTPHLYADRHITSVTHQTHTPTNAVGMILIPALEKHTFHHTPLQIFPKTTYILPKRFSYGDALFDF